MRTENANGKRLWETLQYLMPGRLFVCASLACLLNCGFARADLIVVPNGNAETVGNTAAITPFSSGGRLQQFHASSEFSGAAGDQLEIRELRFRIDDGTVPVGSSFSRGLDQISIRMSTSDRTFATVSRTMSENHGSDLFVALPASDLVINGVKRSETSFDIVIPLPNHFVYDRTRGNLVVDIQIPGPAVFPRLDANGNFPESTYSIFSEAVEDFGQRTTTGLVTQFVYTVVPEPGSGILLVMGVLCSGRLRRGMHQ